MTDAPPPILCLGEAVVDLIGEEPVRSMGEIRRFAPHLGGTVANVAAFAARAGASVALAGGAGADPWGRWLARRLAEESVDVTRFALLADVQTQLAFVAVDARGEPTYRLYGELSEVVADAVGDRVEPALAESSALVISSNTLVGERERAVTMAAREAALAGGRPVIFDCNLRLHRWQSAAAAAAAAGACIARALLVRANQAEAELLTGEDDPERSAPALCAAGAQMVVITLGSGGAILRGECRAEVAATPARVVSTVGAGDAFTGTLLARLAAGGFAAPAVAAAMAEAAQTAARVCERWGALD